MLQFPAPVQQAHLRRNGVQRRPGHAGRGDAQPVDRLQRVELRDSCKILRSDLLADVQPTPAGGAVHHAQLQQIPVVLSQHHFRHVCQLALVLDVQQHLPVALKILCEDLLRRAPDSGKQRRLVQRPEAVLQRVNGCLLEFRQNPPDRHQPGILTGVGVCNIKVIFQPPDAWIAQI